MQLRGEKRERIQKRGYETRRTDWKVLTLSNWNLEKKMRQGNSEEILTEDFPKEIYRNKFTDLIRLRHFK